MPRAISPRSVGNKPDKLITDAIRRAVLRQAEKGKPTKRLELLADRLVEKGIEGDVSAIKEIADRLEGKAAQAVTVAGENGGPVLHRVEVVIIDPKGAA